MGIVKKIDTDRLRVWRNYDPYHWKGISLAIALTLLGVGGLLDSFGIVPFILSWHVTNVWPIYLLDTPFWYALILLAGFGHLLDTFHLIKNTIFRVIVWWYGLTIVAQIAMYYGVAMWTTSEGRPLVVFAVYLGLAVSDLLLIILGPPLATGIMED